MTRIFSMLALALLAGTPVPATAQTSADSELHSLYEKGTDFESYQRGMKKKGAIWKDAYSTAKLPPDVEYTAQRIPGQWRLLVVSEELCHDSQNTVPYLVALADSMPGLDLRIVDSKLGKSVMEARRTPDDRGATPTVVILDEHGVDSGCWIERPAALQTFYLENKHAFRNADKHDRERLETEFMRWYERDAGATTLREVILLLDAAARGARGCSAPKTTTTSGDAGPN